MGENVLKIVLNEVQGQGTNIQTVENFQLKKTTQLTLTAFANAFESSHT